MAVPAPRRKLRFIAVGAINTLIDFALLFGLHSLGMPTLVANMFSTGTAFIFSFFANRSYTFEASEGVNLRTQAWKFAIVTLSSLWIVQGIIIAIAEPIFSQFFSAQYATLLAKLLATGASLVYNYYFYANFVFRHTKK
jgi:putative flippase GtrA